MAFIRGVSGGSDINHLYATGEVSATLNRYDAKNGDFDGTLWNFIDAGGGNVFIQAVAGGRYINHSFATGEVSASIERYDPATGAYDGTLWRLLDAGNGAAFIQAVAGGRYLNHSYATGKVTASVERFDPATNAFDGTLWRIIKGYRMQTNGLPTSGNGSELKNFSGADATVQAGQVTLDLPPGSEVKLTAATGQGSIIQVTVLEVTPFAAPAQVAQVSINTSPAGGGGGNSGNAFPTHTLSPEGQIK